LPKKGTARVTVLQQIENRATADLKPYAKNSRLHSPEQIAQIAASITRFGFTMPILVDEAGEIIAGHGRVLAAKQLGRREVPVIVAAGWDEARKRAYVIADNKLAENATWDKHLLGAELADLQLAGFDLGALGFAASDVAALVALASQTGADPDEVLEPPKVAATVLGDLWCLGPHRVLCGDATADRSVSRLLAGAKPQLMVTDPPYGVAYDPSWRVKAGVGGAGTAQGKLLNDDRADWREAWALFPGAVAYVWHGGLHAGAVAASLEAVGFGIRAQIIWVKSRAALSRGHYHWQHEPALYAQRPDTDDGWRFEPDHEVGAYAVRAGQSADWCGGRKQTTVWEIFTVKNDTGHSTQKPVECMRRPILNNSKGADVVYDPFLGSGTTLIAADMEGRVCYGLELSPLYCDVIIERWQRFTGKAATLESSGQSFDQVKAERVPDGD
jgi:DNA modification methylase